MPELTDPILKEKLRTGLKIRTPFGLFLSEDVSPVILLADYSGEVPADLGYPRRCMGRVVVAAGGAGTQAQAILEGRGDRGIVYVVNRVVVSDDSATRFEVRTGQAVTGAPTERLTKSYMDLRVTGDAAFQPNALMSVNTPLAAAVIGQVIATYRALGSTNAVVDLGIVLGDGQFVNVVVDNTNAGFTCNFFWTEHLAEDR